MLTITPLPAFSDNYIWVCHNATHAMVVDPGDAQPVLQFLQAHRLSLAAIVVTHHHPDHAGGLAGLLGLCQGPVVGPAREQARIAHISHPVDDGDHLELLNTTWRVISVPGHTAGHVAYLGEPADQAPVLFCGDTLFSGGCGRLFEGTAAQMHASLQKLAALRADTQVCCAHEYTLANLRFAQAVEPQNPDIAAYRAQCEQRRAGNLPTLPSSILQERAINPFLRVAEPAVRASAVAFAQTPLPQDADVLGALREWKNQN